jgi:hypothetical protein
MIRFGSLLASSFFIFPFSGLRAAGKLFVCYNTGFSPANLSEQLFRVVVGVESVSH